MTSPGREAWDLATLALDLLAIDPQGLGGISLRARSGPVRETFLAAMAHLPQQPQRIHPAMSHEGLFGGLDLTATLSSGNLVKTRGILGKSITPVLTMAERCPADRASELAAWLDKSGGPMILLDEGAEDAECAPPALTERVAFHVSLEDIGRLEAVAPPQKSFEDAREAINDVITNPDALVVLTTIAARLGVGSMRAPLFAVRAARALAARENRDEISENDIKVAATLVLAPRATQMPESSEENAPAPPSEPETKGQSETQITPEDILVEAVRPHLPDNLLEVLAARKSRQAKGSGAGQTRRSNRRGRPLPSRPGRLGTGARIDFVATLRAAAPWQIMRGRGDGPVKVLPSDVRLRRYEEKSDRLVIFAVDASGSAAMARLAEAKGAVETLLSQAYASRDHVALLSFKGENAELQLPPTRSLVQTKRRLSGLLGGGGTPLAAGLKSAGELALQARSQGLTPSLALLTDGRANIALDGQPNRTAAKADALAMAEWLFVEGVPAIVFDTGNRPDAGLQQLAGTMAATYLPLPRADAKALGKALRDGLDA